MRLIQLTAATLGLLLCMVGDANAAEASLAFSPSALAEGSQASPAGTQPQPVVFKVRGQGFAIKDIDGGTEVETDIWEVVVYDTHDAFNTTTRRFIAPESGYYYLNAVVDQANSPTTAFFRLRFNLDPNARYGSTVDGDDVKTRVSGIYFLSQGTEVYTLLRNFTDGDDERIDGAFSWFEGYKINNRPLVDLIYRDRFEN